MKIDEEVLTKLAITCYESGKLDGIAQNDRDFKDSVAQVAVNLVIDVLLKESKK